MPAANSDVPGSPLDASSTDTMPPQARLAAIDALRGLAVVLMLGQHLVVWLPNRETAHGRYGWLLDTISGAGGMAAPLFCLLAGVGIGLSWQRRGTPRSIDTGLIARGVVLLAFGYALSFATPNWFSWRSWYILHLLGASTIVAGIFARLTPQAWLVAAGLVFAITGPLQALTHLPTSLSNPDMAGATQAFGFAASSPLAVHAYIAGFAGHFPFFAWAAMVFTGIYCGYQKEIGGRHLWQLALAYLVLGGLLFASYFSGWAKGGELWQQALLRASVLHVPFFPASPALLLCLASGALILLWLALSRYDRIAPVLSNSLVAAGRLSLTILLVHIVVFREFTRPFGLWQANGLLFTLTTLSVTIVATAWMAKMWQAKQLRFSFEWLLRKLAAAIARRNG